MRRTLKLLSLAAAPASVAILAATAAAATSPSVQTGTYSAVSDTGAVLHGTVDPGGAATTYVFMWGPTTAYGTGGAERSAGRGTSSVSVTASVSGLLPGTTYHYRLVAISKLGITVGVDRTFTTAGYPPPEVTTGPATALGTSFTTLTAVVQPRGAATTWQFQYGTTPSYGVETFGGTVPAGTAPITVSVPVEGLEPGTIFHYRIVARHAGFATQYGGDAVFMTFPSPRPIALVRAVTSPRRARRRPYLFTISGAVLHPGWIPSSYACSGEATIRLVLARRQVGFAAVQVRPNCTFHGQVLVARPGGVRRRAPERVRVLVSFRGNPYLGPSSARPQQVLVR